MCLGNVVLEQAWDMARVKEALIAEFPDHVSLDHLVTSNCCSRCLRQIVCEFARSLDGKRSILIPKLYNRMHMVTKMARKYLCKLQMRTNRSALNTSCSSFANGILVFASMVLLKRYAEYVAWGVYAPAGGLCQITQSGRF